ncbi:hypothetical protein [Kitasatospora sp. NPDC088134]|uniref:hypothetical protein n=1 Tax=Kitasatospora sp. NPDC088134 TaxID=3364071 RepID=UPI0038047491
MPAFEAVAEARLERVTAAADAWSALRNRYLGLHDQLTQQVADRMAAFGAALGNNPKAVTAFLDSGPDGTNGHLEYLLKDRKWPADNGHAFPGGVDLGAGPLGPALEAAATGDPDDSSVDVMQRHAANTQNSSQVVVGDALRGRP